MRADLIVALSKNPFFGELDSELREVLSKESDFCTYEPGEALVTQGDTSTDFFIILKARASGNRLLNDALKALVSGGQVEYEEAISKSIDKEDLARRCGR
jgi:CRP-like cAMP-binding protein